MLTDNGQYTSDDVAAMTILDIFRAYNSPDFNPEFAFYTMADENGGDLTPSVSRQQRAQAADLWFAAFSLRGNRASL